MWWVVGVVSLVVLVATYVTWIAARVDRLHARAVAAFAALDAQLVRRAAAAAELGEQMARADVQAMAKSALAAPPGERELAENDLTRALRELQPPTVANGAVPPAGTLVEASRRVALARQVHTDLVRDALAVRRRPLVRLLRLGRKHPLPRFFDVDETTLDGVEAWRAYMTGPGAAG